MFVDTFDPDGSLPRTFVISQGGRSLAALVDGSGSWGSGAQAADWNRERLRELWTRSLPGPSSAASDVLETAARTPAALRHDEFGWGFSAVVLLCERNSVAVISSGLYAIRLVTSNGLRVICRPRMLSDDVVKRPGLSEAEANLFPHPDVCLGPYVGETSELWTGQESLAQGDRLLVSHHLREMDFGPERLLRVSSAREATALMNPTSIPSPVILIKT